jgi:uncharacterized iron-regulated protein
MIAKKHLRPYLTLLFLLLTGAVSSRVHSQSHHQLNPTYIPQRVYDADAKRFSDFESLLSELARADVVFVGEQHDDPATHRLERALLEGLLRRRANITVALEMFERDVQKSLDDYLAQRINEEDFLKVARPWPRYAIDYRPLVEFARAHGGRVLASNVPRRLAAQVSKQGLEAINTASETDRKFIAAQQQCPMDDYFKRFKEVMASGHPGAHSQQPNQPLDKKGQEEQLAMIERFYYAQCIKDETMAESIANEIAATSNAPAKPLIVHFNGAFHSDYRLGAAERTVRRLPKAKIIVTSIVPVENLDTIKVDEYRKRGDYIIFTLKPTLVKTKDVPVN